MALDEHPGRHREALWRLAANLLTDSQLRRKRKGSAARKLLGLPREYNVAICNRWGLASDHALSQSTLVSTFNLHVPAPNADAELELMSTFQSFNANRGSRGHAPLRIRAEF